MAAPPEEFSAGSESAGEEPKSPAELSRKPERRQLTVMFCDLVGSTQLASRLDPEDFREIVSAYQRVCVEVVDRFEGYIAQYSGDGVVVYFGYPRAHEDDPQRAVRAGLALIDAMRDLNAGLEREWGITLSVRVGIHTGLAVVGWVGAEKRGELTASGETPAVAARLQSEAEPDTVVVSPTTYRLIDGYFTTEELGERDLEGLPERMTVRRVLEETGARTRLDVPAAAGLTPLVGRESEIGLALDGWIKAKKGLGQVILISGEPGIGKSRLVREISDRLSEGERAPITLRCSPYYANSALYPVIDHLERRFEFTSDEEAEARVGKLERGLGDFRLSNPDAVPLFASLLGIALAEDALQKELTPQQQKLQTLELLSSWLVEEAERQSLLVVEDLHWADPSTLELLELLVEEVATSRLLLIVTTRPEFTVDWASRSYVSALSLLRLAPTQVSELIARALHGKMLPPEVHEQVSAKTDGVPLFVEELVKMILESGLVAEENGRYVLTGSLPTLAIPETLKDSLTARLDNLGAAKETAQVGATLGREFAYELIEAVSSTDPASLQRHLEQLVAAELLFQRGRPPDARYQFKHALIRDAAYQAILKSTRQEHHRRVALVLEKRFAETVETQPELVAHHYTEAGLTSEAVSYWQRAGERAVEQFANVEARSHLSKGLELLAMLPDTSERAKRELAFRIPLGNVLVATRGYASAEVEENYRRALELVESVGETPDLFPVLWGRHVSLYIGARHAEALELAEKFLRLAKERDDASVVVAHRAVGLPLLSMGDFSRAHEHLRTIDTVNQRGEGLRLRFVYASDPEASNRGFLSWTLWFLGYPDRARAQAETAIARAEELSHPLSLAFALGMTAMLHQFLREPALVLDKGGATAALTAEHEIPSWHAWTTAVCGWAKAKTGEIEEGIAQLRGGIEAARRTGSRWSSTYFLALLAVAEREAGRPLDALRILDEALAFADDHRELFYAAEIHRLRGEVLLETEGLEGNEAERCFQQALELARQQESKSLELRAAVSLAQLGSTTGDHGAARKRLEDVYGWFTEGFDTRDLKEAEALLDELDAAT